ncbi:MAG: zinc-dependent dehydrogenase [Acidobacteriaceae bacterium]
MQTVIQAQPEGLYVLPSTMLAAVYRGVNDVRMEGIALPEIEAGELLVKLAACGICGTDLKKIHTGSHSAPRVFGHEMAGTVVRTGAGVARFSVGDRVMVFHHIPCGRCYYCRKQTFAQCPVYKRVGATAGFEAAGGGFAEYIRVMDWIVESGVVKMPDHVSFEQAAFIEPVNTCLKGVKSLRLEIDDSVLVIGQGPIGVILGALAGESGATVIGSDLYARRLELAREFGIQEAIDASKEDVIAMVKKMTEGRGADAVIVAVGGDALIKTAMEACRPGGRVMLFASTQHGDAMIDPAAVCMEEKSLLGSYSASVAIQEETAELVFSGKYDFTRLISHRFALHDAVEALKLASNPRADSMKVFIEAQGPTLLSSQFTA